MLVLAATVSTCTAYGANFYFPPGTLVTCMGQSRLTGETVVANIPIIPIQPGEPGTVYLPVDSPFRSPLTGPISAYLKRILLDFLGKHHIERLTSVGDEFPRVEPSLPSVFLPLPESPPERENPVSSGAIPGGAGTTAAPNKDYTEDIRLTLQMLNPIRVDPADYEFIISVVTQLTDRCEVMPAWRKLPDGQYFPQWISGAFCSGANCSLPEGLHCNAVLTEDSVVLLPILRWDCCWSIVNNQWRWECGWQKVKIQLITRCTCSCFDDIGGLYSHTGRISGQIMANINNLNT